jgi:ABC-type phosphate transport system auxiliary subunit
MKHIIEKLEKYRLTHKLHQLQKRYKRARLNGYSHKLEEYARRIAEIQEKLSLSLKMFMK